MPDHAYADGDVLDATTLNTYVREQVVTTCTSSTRPTNVEGRLIYETDTDRLLMGTGSGTNWITLAEPSQSWTPTISGLTVGNGTWNAVSRRHDGWCTVRGSFTLGSISAITGALVVTLPYTPSTSTGHQGIGKFFDTSASTVYEALVGSYSSTQIYLAALGTGSTYGSWTATSSTIPFTWATGDLIQFQCTFQMANRYA